MNIRYDQDIDAIYFDLKDVKSNDSDEILDGIIIDYDNNENIVGIEVLDFKYKVSKGLTINDLPFTETERACSEAVPLASHLNILTPLLPFKSQK